MRGSVSSWEISGRPPEVVSAGAGAYAVWIPARGCVFIVRPAEKPHGSLSAPQVAQLVEKARQQSIPDLVIGSCQVIAVGDAWQHEGHVRAQQQLLVQRGLDQLALVDGREPWYKRLWAHLWGPAEA
ncbi:MAG: hypothetical protein AUH69_05540 [Actinobacteria bacterium 13_1_40CM_4_65_12]|nr:MAG: hypothetical protein AUH31_06275 [Armatimonadetes bacterium 13_1_40CM_64_14]OLC67019.1 MAG: hypothetical protein AUH69_05540 [Actinobacteria bacterium 13_1_40CM_4_65_12]